MVCVYPLVVVLLTTPFAFAGPNEDPCDVHGLVGHSLTLKLDHNTLADTLRWTHNQKIIFARQSNVIREGKPTDVDAAGALLLRNLDFSNAGLYSADMLNRTGARVNGWRGRVCVTEKVSKPEVTFVCGSTGATATLSCKVRDARDVVFAWTHEGQLLKGETKPTLSVSLAKFKGDKGFICSVRNGASQDQSSAVRLKCEQPPLNYCFKASTVMAAAAGGGGLLLLFLVVTLVLCFRRNKETRPERQADLPMVPTAEHGKADRAIPDYEVMHPSGVSPRPSPKPSPTVFGRDVLLPVARAHEGPGTTAPEGKQEPSPVPKPRTKTPQTAGNF